MPRINWRQARSRTFERRRIHKAVTRHIPTSTPTLVPGFDGFLDVSNREVDARLLPRLTLHQASSSTSDHLHVGKVNPVSIVARRIQLKDAILSSKVGSLSTFGPLFIKFR
ncbi:uncharacterized protein PV06_03927 [Exophiala oligosperma]|uniref:Uncharacterized protein n=1 Tax=Exophiala oligosperma TaxID=215243 RepID=A0A0D2EC78_9EURO|nr:uncharacterized protein PV06_03927 [Exophiala oligosperma]KIW45544.1 hypothetical protein PV06_03927 [Exophiala oligosperma]